MICSVDSCHRPPVARGLCRKHYKQWQRHGRAWPDRTPQVCAVSGCGQGATERGWCHGHYLRWQRTGGVAPERPLRTGGRPECEVDGCPRRAVARGLCRTHYARLRTTGDVQADRPITRGEGNGGLSHGYWKVTVPPELLHLTNGERHVLEHRLVMAQLLGRALAADETVHHINGDRLDNRPANLELWSGMQPAGQRIDDKVNFAIEILRRYRPELLADESLRSGEDNWTVGA